MCPNRALTIVRSEEHSVFLLRSAAEGHVPFQRRSEERGGGGGRDVTLIFKKKKKEAKEEERKRKKTHRLKRKPTFPSKKGKRSRKKRMEAGSMVVATGCAW